MSANGHSLILGIVWDDIIFISLYHVNLHVIGSLQNPTEVLCAALLWMRKPVRHRRFWFVRTWLDLWLYETPACGRDSGAQRRMRGTVANGQLSPAGQERTCLLQSCCTLVWPLSEAPATDNQQSFHSLTSTFPETFSGLPTTYQCGKLRQPRSKRRRSSGCFLLTVSQAGGPDEQPQRTRGCWAPDAPKC